MALEGFLPDDDDEEAARTSPARSPSRPPTRPPQRHAPPRSRATAHEDAGAGTGGAQVADRTEASSPVTLADGTETELDHGHVVIAAITSCTNTSNPSVMIGAGLLARNAVERGLTVKPWVKTSLAPGSKVVTEYYERAELIEPLEALGFHLVGYGCTTCIGNSGPLPEEISDVVDAEDLAVVSVLCGNRNFEGRINPDVKMNYLASPPLCVAYALAGTMDIDLLDEPLGHGRRRRGRLPQGHLAERRGGRAHGRGGRAERTCSASPTARSSRATSAGTRSRCPRATASPGTTTRPTCASRRSSRTCQPEPAAVEDIEGARVLALLGDSVTTDHISPAGAIKKDSPAAKYLNEHGVANKDFNSYGARRGNHEVMMRGTFANIRLRNVIAGKERGRRHGEVPRRARRCRSTTRR